MPLFNDDEQLLIKQAVQAAEKNTSGEIRVCVEKTCSEDVLDRAAKYFKQLDMHKSKLCNGVLIYLVTEVLKFAIIGDGGINQQVPVDFWDQTKLAMLEQFKQGNLVQGIVTGVTKAGEQLKKYFPYQLDDSNELSDDVSFMDGD